MKSKFLRRTAIAVSMSAFALSGVASADQRYSSPSRWNNFRPALDEALLAEDSADDLLGGADDLLGGVAEDLPAPRMAAPRGESIQQGRLDRSAVKEQMQRGSYQPAPSNQQSSMHHQDSMQHQGSTSRNDSSYNNQPMGNVVTGQPHYSGGYPPASYSNQQSYSSGHQHSSAPQHMGNYSTMPTPAMPIVGSDGVATGTAYPSYQGDSGYAHTGSSPSPYAQAMSSPWEGDSSCGGQACGDGNYESYASGFGGGRPDLFPWFGGANILFFTLQEGQGRAIASGLNSPFRTSDLDPSDRVGFDVSLGRYIGCGRYGLGVRFFQWHPDAESITSAGSDIRAAQPQYRDALLDLGSGSENVYDHIDGETAATSTGTPALDGGYQVRMTRELNFYGIELNLFSFGLMGAQRAAYAGCAPASHGLGAGLGLGHGRGLGGAAGPLVRSNSGRTRITTSHGIRYLRITDETNIAYGVDTTSDGVNRDGRVTIFDDLDTENELLGYQFGGMLTYCLGNRLDLNIGGKFGIYGNRATMEHRLGTDTQVAYLTAGGVDNIDTRSTDTVLSTLGELDLGLGYRVSRGWTVRGGYRLMGVTGVANAIDSRTVAYNSVADLGQVHADDSYLLHGAYVGANYNW
jgi:hypothetical protein